MTSVASRLASLVKLEHTVFALPFALAGMTFALRSVDRTVTVSVVVWIVLAMVGARSFAMAVNRFVDRVIDAHNPRTSGRELPSGALSSRQVTVFILVSLVVLVVAAWNLDPVVRWLWPIPVVVFVAYPYTKRVTWMCHMVLGVSLGMAPLAAWIAVTGRTDTTVWLLSGAVTAWVTGFDIIYATQDVDVDRAQGLHSIPAKYGLGRALAVTRLLHVACVVLLVAVGLVVHAGVFYWFALSAVSAALAMENRMVSPTDLSHVNAAFFTVNGVVGFVYLAGVLLA